MTIKLAHIRHQGVDLIIVPLKSDFRWKSQVEQRRIVDELQDRASNARLAGTVVPVWDAGAGRMGFAAPTRWHSFFKSISLLFISRNLNKTLSW
jgi:hypothetical protein